MRKIIFILFIIILMTGCKNYEENQFSQYDCFTPTFSLPSGAYDLSTSVTLSNIDPNVKIKYTTDSTDPKTSATAVIANPGVTIPINTKSVVIKAYAYGQNKTDSAVVQANYTLNWKDPFLDISSYCQLSDPIIFPTTDNKFFLRCDDKLYKWENSPTLSDLGSLPFTLCQQYGMGSDNKPILAGCESGASQNIRIKKYDTGTNWTDWGTINRNTSAPSMLAVGTDSKPYFVYVDSISGSYVTKVVRFDSPSSSTDYSFPSNTNIANPIIALDSSNNIFILYFDQSLFKYKVLKSTAPGAWVSLGELNYDHSYTNMHHIVIGSDNIPVLLFNINSPYQTVILKWNSGTSWDIIGTFSNETNQIFMGYNSKPFISYSPNKVRKHLSGTSWTSMYSLSKSYFYLANFNNHSNIAVIDRKIYESYE